MLPPDLFRKMEGDYILECGRQPSTGSQRLSSTTGALPMPNMVCRLTIEEGMSFYSPTLYNLLHRYPTSRCVYILHCPCLPFPSTLRRHAYHAPMDDFRIHPSLSSSLAKAHAFRSTASRALAVKELQNVKGGLCKGRRIGDEWEVDGVRFKVGSEGKRLQKMFVKVFKPKFKMVSREYLIGWISLMVQPADSVHLDRFETVTTIVERWYNEDQYEAANEAYEFDSENSDKSSKSNRKIFTQVSCNF